MVYKTGEVKTPINELTAGGGLASRDFRVLAKVLTLPGASLLSGCTSEQDKFLQKGGFDNYFALPVIENSKIDNNNPLDSAKTISAIYAEKGGDPFLIYEKQGQGGSIQRESYPIHLLYFGTADAIENVVIIAPNDPQTKDETWKSDMNKSQALLTLELNKPVSKETLDNWQTDPNSVDVKKISFWDPLNGQGITVGEESNENPREVAMLLIAPSTARPSEQVSYTPTANVVPTGTPIDTLPSPSSLPPVVTMTELGITDPNSDLAKAFSGIEKTVTLEADGSFSVNAIGYQGETRVEGKYIIVPGSFNANLDIENDFRPTTIDAYVLDADGKKTDQTIKLIWDKDHGQWRMLFNMFEDRDFTRTSEHAFIPEGDEKIAIESSLLYFRDHPPFGDGTVESYNENGGNSLLFRFLEGVGKYVNLKSKGNDTVENLSEDKATMKFSGLWVWQNIDGQRQDIPLIVILDPSDPENPSAKQFKVLLGVGDYDFSNLTEEDRQYLLKVFNDQNNFSYPLPVLYGDEDYQKNFPLLAKLLGLSGNDPSTLDFWSSDINIRTNELSSTNRVSETPLITPGIPYQVPPEIQLMRLFFQLLSKNPIN